MARKDQEKLQLLTVVQLYSRRAFPTTKLIGQIGAEKHGKMISDVFLLYSLSFAAKLPKHGLREAKIWELGL